jgi:hypothetical protein
LSRSLRCRQAALSTTPRRSRYRSTSWRSGCSATGSSPGQAGERAGTTSCSNQAGKRTRGVLRPRRSSCLPWPKPSTGSSPTLSSPRLRRI